MIKEGSSNIVTARLKDDLLEACQVLSLTESLFFDLKGYLECTQQFVIQLLPKNE